MRYASKDGMVHLVDWDSSMRWPVGYETRCRLMTNELRVFTVPPETEQMKGWRWCGECISAYHREVQRLRKIGAEQ